MTSLMLLKSNNKTYSLGYEEFFKEQYPPNMTSDVLPSPYVASASSYSTEPYRAFDSNITTTTGYSWRSLRGTSHWLKIDFGEGNDRIIKGFHIHGYTSIPNDMRNPSSMILYGSNDNVTFVPLYTHGEISSSEWSRKQTYKFNNSVPYRYYRINFTLSETDTIKVRDFRLYEYSELSTLVELPSVLTEDYFINYGVNLINNFNQVNTDKNYILSKNESGNTDGLWEQEIDRKPLSIKFE